MKAFVTGATGFIGERLVRRLRDRGDDVVALARSREKGAKLEQMGASLVEGDLSSSDAIHTGVQGCDAVFHIAAVYKVGIPKSEHEAMYDANVRGTERVIDSAGDAGEARIVYVSTGTGPYNDSLDPIQVNEWWLLAETEVMEMAKRKVPGVWTYGFYDGWAPNYRLLSVANLHNSIGRFYETYTSSGAGCRIVKLPAADTSRRW